MLERINTGDGSTQRSLLIDTHYLQAGIRTRWCEDPGRLNRLCVATSMTPREICSLVGVSHVAFDRWENSKPRQYEFSTAESILLSIFESSVLKGKAPDVLENIFPMRMAKQ